MPYTYRSCVPSSTSLSCTSRYQRLFRAVYFYTYTAITAAIGAVSKFNRGLN